MRVFPLRPARSIRPVCNVSVSEVTSLTHPSLWSNCTSSTCTMSGSNGRVTATLSVPPPRRLVATSDHASTPSERELSAGSGWSATVTNADSCFRAGFFVGVAVGVFVGLGVGVLVGLLVGLIVGVLVGLLVGVLVGAVVGV